MKHSILAPACVAFLVFATGASAQRAPRSDATVPNLVANPGFELGMGIPHGWKVTKKEGFSMSAEAHTGNWCIALSSPQGEWPVVEQQVRLIPDRTYVLSFWYRSEGGGRDGMHVRFEGTDPRTDKRWGFHHKLGHAPEWTRHFFLVRPKTLAPTLAFHNYCSKGRTFYIDDVSIDMNLAALVEMTEPTVADKPLASNTPTFRWRPEIDPKYLSFELLYARSRTFPSRTTVVVPDLLEATKYTPFEPLANGIWYWKLRFTYNNLREGSTAEGESETAVFRVASDGKDHRPPRVEHWGPTRIVDGTAAEIVVEYADNPSGSGIDPDGVRLAIDGVDVTVQCEVSPQKLVFRPKSLADAVYCAEITIADRAGNTARKKWWFLVKPKPERGVVGWDSDRKVFLDDGEPFFPFGMYQYRYDNPYDAYRGWGFNTVHFYDGTLPPGVRAASRAGLKVFALDVVNKGVPEQASFFDEKTPLEDHPALPIIAQRIFEVCNEPSLFCWSIRDEPDKEPMSRARLKALHEFVKRLDPYHLTNVVLMKYGAYSAYADVADLIVGDVYPYSIWTGSDQPEMIWDQPIHQDRAQGGDRPVLTILQHFGGRQGTNFPHVVPEGMRRFMAYLSYIHGTRGMMWYAYGSSDYGTAPEYPEQWEDMKRLAGEIEPMIPILLSDDATEDVQMRVIAPPNHTDRYGNPAVHFTTKSHDDKRYLIAVNATKEPVRAAFRIAAAVQSVRELQTDRKLDVSRSTGFLGAFEPRSAHVYEIFIRGRSAAEAASPETLPSTHDMPEQPVRTWLDRTGRYRVEAEMVEIDDGVVHLRKPDGSLLHVPLGQLSDEDQEHVRAWQRKGQR